LSGFDRILLLESNGNSHFDGLVLQANKPMARHFQFLASYTFGNVTDDKPTLGVINPGPSDGELLMDSRDQTLDQGNGDSDQRHRLVFSGIWDLGYATSGPRPLKSLLTGWQVSGVVTAQSGQPYSGALNFDLNNDGNASTDRPPGLGRNTFYLPENVTFDTRVTRKIAITERWSLRASVDVYNLFNRVNLSGVNNVLYVRSTSPADCGSSGTPCLVPQTSGKTAFGTPTVAMNPRMMQFSLRMQF
jgi:hypothetical protein